jgi:hypothetical protein
MFDLDYDEEVELQWLAEARAEAKENNPLFGYCQRVYFTRTSCRRRSGRDKGKKRKRTTHEVELLKFLPSGRCVQVCDLKTKGLDSLAEEVFAGKYIPPDVNPAQLFLDYFREL